jgi:hypothetical protein
MLKKLPSFLLDEETRLLREDGFLGSYQETSGFLFGKETRFLGENGFLGSS